MSDDWLSTPPPEVSEDRLQRWLSDHWGITGTLGKLYAERDLNLRVDGHDGSEYLLKVSHPDSDQAQLDFQNRALCHLAESAPELPVAHLIPIHSGAPQALVSWRSQPLCIRLFTWLSGESLDLALAPTEAAKATGKILAMLGLALRNCSPAGAPRALPWDLMNFQMLSALKNDLPDELPLTAIEATVKTHKNTLLPALNSLPAQVIHNDLNPDNVLFSGKENPQVTGIIDFGDMVEAPIICDLAIAAAYMIDPGSPRPLKRVLEAIAAYDSERPLTNLERSLLPGLIAARLATTCLIQGRRVTLGQDHDGDLERSYREASGRLTLFHGTLAAELEAVIQL